MHAVGIAAIAHQFGVNGGAACHGVFVFFQNQAACAFAYDQAIAVFVVRARGFLWRIVAATGGKQHIEYRRLGGAQFFGTTRYHHGLFAVFNRFIRLADGHRA